MKRFFGAMWTLWGLFAFVWMAGLIFAGCGTVSINHEASYCDSLADGSHSVLCEIAAFANTTPETVGKILKVANTAALASDLYTAGQALAFAEDIRAALASATDGITYQDAVAYAVEKYKALPAKVAGAFVVVTEFADIDAALLENDVLSQIDVDKLLAHLDEQIAIIRMMGAVAKLQGITSAYMAIWRAV